MLTQRVDLFDSTYGHFTEDVLATIRRETFGQDIGQNSWLTVEEYDRFISWLKLCPEQHLLRREDVTVNAAVVAGRWHRSRHRHREALLEIEGEERYEGLQKFFAAVHRLTSERRLSRIAYLVEKPAD
jgi:hypothetical protein